jgi:hypothetical protein
MNAATLLAVFFVPMLFGVVERIGAGRKKVDKPEPVAEVFQ